MNYFSQIGAGNRERQFQIDWGLKKFWCHDISIIKEGYTTDSEWNLFATQLAVLAVEFLTQNIYPTADMILGFAFKLQYR